MKKRRARIGREDKSKRYLLVMIFIAGGSMLLSGVYYISYREQPEMDVRTEIPPYVEQYSTEMLGNSSVLVRIKEVRNQIITLATGCANIESLYDLQNASIPGVNSIGCEISNPSIDPAFGIICGSYIMFKFDTTEINETIRRGVERNVRGVMRNFNMMEGYIAILPINVSGTDEIYIVGEEGIGEGEYVKAFLFSKTGGVLGSLIGFEEKEVPSGPEFLAEVVNLTQVGIQGTLSREFNLDDIMERLNLTKLSTGVPAFIVNGTISQELVKELNNLSGVKVKIEGKRSEIQFNQSWQEIQLVMEREELNYSLRNGSIMFPVSLNTSLDQVRNVLQDNNVHEIKMRKGGLVSLPEEIVLNGRLVRLENNEAFSAALNLTTEIGDRINVTIGTITFGEQIIPIQASEV